MKRLLKEKTIIFFGGLFLSIFLFSSNYVGVEGKKYKPTGILTKVARSPKKVGRKLIGKMAPDFVLDTLTGEKYRLSQTRGKVVLIDFWHTY